MTPTIPLRAPALVLASTLAAAAGASEEISRKAGFAICHAVDRNGVGSS